MSCDFLAAQVTQRDFIQFRGLQTCSVPKTQGDCHRIQYMTETYLLLNISRIPFNYFILNALVSQFTGPHQDGNPTAEQTAAINIKIIN